MSTDLIRSPFLFVLLWPRPNCCVDWNLAAAHGSRGLAGWPAWLAGALQTRLPGQSRPGNSSFACAAFQESCSVASFLKMRRNRYAVAQVCILKAFLRQNEQYLQRVVAISNVGGGKGGFKEAYAVLVGVGQYLCHFAKAGKGRPNAEIKFDPNEGFNVGALYLSSTTRNFSGISEGKEIVIDFGAGYAFDDAEQPAAKKFKGALDVLFGEYQQAQGAENEEPQPSESADPSGQPAPTAAKAVVTEVAVPKAVATTILVPKATPALLPPVAPAALPSPSQPVCGGVIVS